MEELNSFNVVNIINYFVVDVVNIINYFVVDVVNIINYFVVNVVIIKYFVVNVVIIIIIFLGLINTKSKRATSENISEMYLVSAQWSETSLGTH